jgi:hypothetical protein
MPTSAATGESSGGLTSPAPLSHPKILISECEPFFPQETYNFQKEFIYFNLKCFYLYLNEFLNIFDLQMVLLK